MRSGLLLILATGCRLFEPSVSHDASPPPIDVATDSTFGPCPTAYESVTGQTSSYRAITAPANFWTHYAACNADSPSNTHLAVIDSKPELDALMASMPPLPGYYVGGVQARDQAATDQGWIALDGKPLISAWILGAPDDGGDQLENNQEQLTAIDPQQGALVDVSGIAAYGAICECDHEPVSPIASDYIGSDPNHPP
jgi:hypothetical protein